MAISLSSGQPEAGETPGRRNSILALLAFIVGVATIVAVIAAGDRYLRQVQAMCDYPPPAASPHEAWYMLPLGVASTVLMALSGGLAYLGRRRLTGRSWWSTGTTLLIPIAVLGVLFCAWFGIVAVIQDGSPAPHCAG